MNFVLLVCCSPHGVTAEQQKWNGQGEMMARVVTR